MGSSNEMEQVDLIDRQAAIDVLGDKPLAWTEGEYELGLQNQWQSDVDALKQLPSAQPEEDCDTCKHGYFGDTCCNNCKVRFPSHYERR